MILSSFSYKTFGWELTEISALELTNLLVGKNATGKTRTIRALKNVTSYMRMESFLFQDWNFKTKMQLANPDDANWALTYLFEIEKGEVRTEQLIVCGKTLIKRDAQKTLLNGDVINPPKDKLVVQVRRDKEEYPDVESLMEWAEGVIAVSCSDINPYTVVNGRPGYISPIPFSALVEALSKEDKKTVIDEAKRLGYDLTDISLVTANSEIKLVAVKERNIQNGILDFQLSSGMIRVLYILCFLEYVKHGRVHSMLLIDDLGEGLDYSRAIHLGRKVFEVCEQENMQLIASSNDSFLMDVVDIAKWQIVRRKNSKLSVINQTNMPELFDEFRMTGLSNFDLFSSDFIDNFITRSAE
ncbi:MAG: ATP-binding protein [Prevotella sp.]|nr:ATP-binding protein [Prevotella sp.]